MLLCFIEVFISNDYISVVSGHKAFIFEKIGSCEGRLLRFHTFWVHAQGGAWVQNLGHNCLRPHNFKIVVWIIDLVYVLYSDRYWSKIFICTFTNLASDLQVNVTDLKLSFFCV